MWLMLIASPTKCLVIWCNLVLLKNQVLHDSTSVRYDVRVESGVLLQSYFYNDDTFNFNYGQAKAAIGKFKEAEEVRSFFFEWNVV